MTSPTLNLLKNISRTFLVVLWCFLTINRFGGHHHHPTQYSSIWASVCWIISLFDVLIKKTEHKIYSERASKVIVQTRQSWKSLSMTKANSCLSSTHYRHTSNGVLNTKEKNIIKEYVWQGASLVVLVLKNPPANAGGHGFDPWSGKIPHAYGRLSLCTAAAETIATRESPSTATKTQESQK